MKKEPKDLSIKQLFESEDYVIPVYQRNYAWSESQIRQLIQDIVDYCKKDFKSKYYIGSLVVAERIINGKNCFETIDGQQRLTTLNILLSFIKKEYKEIDMSWYKLNLKFYSRQNSTNTLQYLFKGDILDNKKCNNSIRQGYEIAGKALEDILDKFDLKIKDFCGYLFENVIVLRVLVPEDTDLNHYFEIMNSRGEQLEKHEILKARCLKILEETDDGYAFNKIWEACSNMEKYVQFGFSGTNPDKNIVSERSRIFGVDWNTLVDEKTVYEKLKKGSSNENEQTLSLKELTRNDPYYKTKNNEDNKESPDRFNTIINFPNFLLQVLKIQTGNDIPLDDKRLFETFDNELLKKDNNQELVKTFGFNLLKCKYLYDKYIIKRDLIKDKWSLKKIKYYDASNVKPIDTFSKEDIDEEDDNKGINRELLMLLSMFHVSAPTLVYKHWLNAALKYVFEKEEPVKAVEYKKYLDDLAKAFLFDRFLTNEPKDYYEIIYTNKGISQNKNIDDKKLNKGTSVDNFIFNYLDYLLWQDYRNDKGNRTFFKDKFDGKEEKEINDARITVFEFTFRSSVEHHYPQNPPGDNPPIERKWLDHFGNLCLISRSDNSTLNNDMPKAKKANYGNDDKPIRSIKQRIMMEYEDWDIVGINEIEEHGKIMKELLLNKVKEA